MYAALLKVHLYWAYLTLGLLIFATFSSFIRFFLRREYSMKKDLRINLYTLIFGHIQFLLGMILYFTSPHFSLWERIGIKRIMRSDVARFILIEHPVINLFAIALITAGWSKHKRSTTSKNKFGSIAFFYGIALLLVLSRLPWEKLIPISIDA